MQAIKVVDGLHLDIGHSSEENANYYQHCTDSPISYPGSVEQPEFLESPSPRMSEDFGYRKRFSNATIVGQSPSSSPIISIAPSSNSKSDPLESNPLDDQPDSPQLNESKSSQQSLGFRSPDAASPTHSKAENQSSNLTDYNNDPFQNDTSKDNNDPLQSDASKENTRDRNKTLSFDTAVTRTDSLITSPESDHPSSPLTNPLMPSSRKLNSNQLSMFEAKPYVPKQRIVRNNTQNPTKVNHCLHCLICCIFPLWLFIWLYLTLSYEPSLKYVQNDEYDC